MKHAVSFDGNIAEKRLVYFGLEMLPQSQNSKGEFVPMSKEEAKMIVDRDKKETGKVRPINRQIKEHLDKLERNGKEEKKEKAGLDKDMDKKLEEMDRRQWMEDAAKDLGIDPKTMKLVEPKVRLRTPAEQHGISVNGKYIGEIAAGYNTRTGREIVDPATADRSKPPVINFTEAGFKEQIEMLIKGAMEK